MKRLALFAAAAAVALQAQAAAPTPASIEKLFTLIKADSMIDAAYANIDQSIRQVTAQIAAQSGNKVTPAQQKVMDTDSKKMTDYLHQQFNWTTMKPALVKVYTETFTQEEIDGLTAFYSSPIGKSFVSKMPVVMQKSMSITQDQMKTVMPKMMEMAQQMAKDVKDTGTTK